MKKGFSLAEVIVAMAIAVIVSLLCYSTCNFAIMQMSNSKTKSFFASQTQNFVNCYFLGSAEYADAINFLTGQAVTYGEDATIYYAKDFSISNQQNSEYHIDLNFESESFVVKCVSNSSQKIIFEVEV